MYATSIGCSPPIDKCAAFSPLCNQFLFEITFILLSTKVFESKKLKLDFAISLYTIFSVASHAQSRTNVKEAKKLIEECGFRMILADDLEEAATKAVGVAEIAMQAELINVGVRFEGVTS